MRTRSIAAAVTVGATVAATAVTGGVASATPMSAASADRVVPGTAPSWTSHATRLGNARARKPIAARVYLQPRGGSAALREAVTAVSTPGSASYHHFLSAAAYRARFDPTAAAVAAVRTYLTDAGLHVTGVGTNNRYIAVSGTAAEAVRAFHTTLGTFRRGKAIVNAPNAALTLPPAVAGDVLTVDGLDTSRTRQSPATKQPAASPSPGFRNATPCSRYYGQVAATHAADYKTALPKYLGKTLPYVNCGYTGTQFRSAYEGGTTLTGKGVRVGIIDAYSSPTIAHDANKYATENGDSAYTAGQLTMTTPSQPYRHQGFGPNGCGANGWYVEETLDVEAVHAMAPDAKIHYYGARSCYDPDFTDTLGQVVDQDKVQLVSNSYGEAESVEQASDIAADDQIFQQAAMEGISFLFSSGDSGDEAANTGVKQADGSGSDPYVTAVGGTATGIGAKGSIEWQTGWGTNLAPLATDGKSWGPAAFAAGAGGGYSRLFEKPTYQDAVNRYAYRSVPDVAMDADNSTGMLIGQTQTFPNGTYYDQYRLGGTSLSSPLFAGMTALAVQQSGPGGFLNPTIYSHPNAFTDVLPGSPDKGVVRVNYVNSVNANKGVSYSVRTFGQDSSLPTTKGYDQVTGLGVPNTKWFSVEGG